MRPAQRRSPAPLIDDLLAQPQRFGLFQAVRLLEAWLRRRGVSDPLGSRHLRFRSPLSLAFTPSEVADLQGEPRPLAPGDRTSEEVPEEWVLTPAGFGLLGASGALPIHYTELLQQRETRGRDADRTAARAFLDIFQHRSTVLFYQAWRKHRWTVPEDRDGLVRARQPLLALAGLGPAALQRRLGAEAGGVSDDAIAFFAATLQRRPVSAASIQRLLAHYLGVPVEVNSFVGRWFTLAPEHRTLLGRSAGTLGAGAVLGERVWQRDLRMRLTLGPLAAGTWERFLPGGAGARALKEWLGLLAGGALEFEVRLSLQPEAVHGTRLDPEHGSRLGWDSFLITRASRQVRHDVGYDLLAVG